jgi:hypothetical protein
MKAYSNTQPNLTHTKNGVTYLNCNAVEETVTDEMGDESIERTQWAYDSVPVKDGNLIAAGIRARYNYEDEIALVNNYNADNSDASGEYAEYQAYRAEIKALVA